jgi:outer membrane protein OmpA-like peptidoglycan-associated protein
MPPAAAALLNLQRSGLYPDFWQSRVCSIDQGKWDLSGLQSTWSNFQPALRLQEDIMKRLSSLKAVVVVLSLTLSGAVMAQQTGASGNTSRKAQVNSGTKMKVKGVIIKRDDSSFFLRDQTGSELTVRLAGNTKIEEKKGNPFRGSKKYSDAQVIRGLNVEIEGHGDSSGDLIADKIKFYDDDLRVALSINSQVVPLENRMGTTENRLTRTEQNAERLSGQLEELGQVANLAKGGAAAAQDTADAAVEGVNKTNDRISSLDDYEVKKSTTITFKVGSAVLSPDAKSMLDDLSAQAKNERGFIIEVRGFASADGSENMNRQLSQRRSDSVVRYLAEQHDIPLRRIILPFGYGEAMPVADNTTREGRQENRRAEVKILVSRGIGSSVNVNRPVSSTRE